MEYSEYQKAILDAVKHKDDNILIQACAGSGKTTTLKAICEHLPPELRAVALCFNKLNADQFRQKLPSHVEASTMHSLGFRIIRENTPGVELNKHKVHELTEKMWGRPQDRGQEYLTFTRAAVQATSMCMAKLIDPNVEGGNEEFFAMVDEQYSHALSVTYSEEEFRKHVAELLTATRADRKTISFDDMIDHVVHFELQSSTYYDVILGDEVQDWNKQQAKFVELLAGLQAEPEAENPLDALMASAGREVLSTDAEQRPTKARVMLVGDRKQAIYAFRGADERAMDGLGVRFSCMELPLSVCYRCPVSVVEEAQKIVGKEFIQARDDAPEGVIKEIESIESDDFFQGLPEGAMVICRTNAPLIQVAIKLISSGRKAVVRGSDIGEALIRMVARIEKRYKCTTITDMLKALRKWAKTKIDKYMQQDQETSAARLQDEVDCIHVISRGLRSLPSLKSKMKQLFSDEISGITLSSIHRSKGLEAETVVIYGPENIPHPMTFRASKGVREQEDNLLYVAITRSEMNLYYVPLPPDDEDEDRVDLC